MIDFLRQRAISGVELVKDNAYFRTVNILNKNNSYVNGWIKVENNSDKNCLNVTVSETLLPVISKVLFKIKRMFDLACDPSSIDTVLKSMNDFKENIYQTGVRLPGCFDTFEMCVRAVLGQQITVKAAGTLAGRIAAEYGTKVKTGIEGLDYAFPTKEKILSFGQDNISDKLGVLGVTSARSKTIYLLAESLSTGKISLDTVSSAQTAVKSLMELPVIGEWTANYIAMRAISWTDAFLPTDYGIKKAMAPLSKKEIMELSEKWRPWRSYAAITLWNSL